MASRKIALVIASLGAGGAERSLLAMARHWREKGWKIKVVTVDSDTTDFFSVPPGVQRIALGLAGPSANGLEALWNNLRRILALRRVIRQSRPQAVISFLDATSVLTLLATRRLGIPVVVSERTDPREHRIGTIWSVARRLVYPLADAVVVQTIAVERWMKSLLPRCKIRVIPNLVETFPSPRAECDNRKSVLLAVGRLSREKGFDLLLRAFVVCAGAQPDWRLIICGEGEERGRLESLAEMLGIDDRVALPGAVQDLAAYYAHADLFVLSSRYEGFPNALIEAMAFGLPVISFDCRSGPAEIIHDGVDGVLVPAGDVEGLAAAVSDLMFDSEKRRRLGHNATAVRERFGAERVMARWEAVLAEVVGQQTGA